MPRTIKEDSKVLKIRKQLEKAIHQPLKDGKEIVLSRSELAQKFKCNPALISYVLKKINAEQTMQIETKRGVNGYIKIKPYSSFTDKIIIPTIVTSKRNEEIESAVKTITDEYFSSLFKDLPKDMAKDSNVIKLILHTVCKTALREGKRNNDSQILMLIQLAVERELDVYKAALEQKETPSENPEMISEDAS